MGLVDETAGKVADNLLTHGPIGVLALVGWLCVVVMGVVIIVIWKALRASEAARLKDLLDDKEAAEKERAEQDRKMDRLQAVLEARKR